MFYKICRYSHSDLFKKKIELLLNKHRFDIINNTEGLSS